MLQEDKSCFHINFVSPCLFIEDLRPSILRNTCEQSSYFFGGGDGDGGDVGGGGVYVFTLYWFAFLRFPVFSCVWLNSLWLDFSF